MEKIKASYWHELNHASEELYREIDSLLKNSIEETEIAKQAKLELKKHYDFYREANNLGCLCAFVTVEGKEKVYAVVFEDKEVDENFYKLEYDEEEDVHYVMA